MWNDPIVDELHRVREAHAARFNNDLRAIVQDLKELEAVWPAPKVDRTANAAPIPQGSPGLAGSPVRASPLRAES